MKVAYLGPKGTFSEEAALRYFHDQPVEFVRFDSIPDVVEAIGEGVVDRAIVPLENTIEGTINMTIDSLLSFDNLYIDGEYTLPVSLHLLANPGTSLSSLKEVWSIPPIFTQCRAYIRKMKLNSLPYDSSASAATHLKHSERTDVAAIGSTALASLLQLTILESRIQDNPDNQTRFITIGRKLISDQTVKKAMFVITPNVEQPGVLSAILNIFSALLINLSWIESRPTAQKLGEYRFFLESDNYCDDELVAKAVAILELLGHHVRILGRYN